MNEGLVVFVIVALAAVFAFRKLWSNRDEDGSCSSCESKPAGKLKP